MLWVEHCHFSEFQMNVFNAVYRYPLKKRHLHTTSIVLVLNQKQWFWKLALKHDRLSNKRLSFSNVCRLLLYWKIIVSGLFTVHMLICWSIVKKNQKTMFALAKTKIQNSNHCKVLLKSGWKVWESLETHFTQILNEMCQQIWNPCDRKLWIIRI